MQLSISEKIRILLDRRKMSYNELAQQIGMSRQNLHYKISQDKLYTKELEAIATALQCSYEFNFIMDDTKEKF